MFEFVLTNSNSPNVQHNFSILVINPNSSEHMTMGLKPTLKDLTHPQLTLDFYTGSKTAPPSIDDEETSLASTNANIPALLPLLSPSTPNEINPTLNGPYDAFLVACFSAHPLTRVLRDHTRVPVLNIFEASLLHARALALPFGIVTTGKYWEETLTNGVREFFLGEKRDGLGVHHSEGDEIGQVRGFVGVRSTGLNASELHSTPKDVVDWRIVEASAQLVRAGAQVIILGCAGMAGMESAVRTGAKNEGKEVRIIDGVRAGVVLLEGLVKSRVL
ncbi:Asp/Glu/hydantoin racemase [Abortiporus biennis]|nr:Asp/Glu/hydantoin racemase [Abortiporus biennis]